MPDIDLIKQNSVSAGDGLYNKKLNPVAPEPKSIGIELDNTILQNIVNSGTASTINMAEIDSFTNISRSRDQLYNLLDQMAADSTISAVLETYVEDATERNDNGDIVWCESNDPDVAAYVGFLLDSLCINKNIYKWTYCLCKYGDVYLRLYRKSDYDDPIFASTGSEKKPLKESIKIIGYADDDRYAHYMEMVDNPAQMFELTRFGKTVGYIQAEIPSQQTSQNLQSSYFIYKYKFNKDDINIYNSTEFVHGSLDDGLTRSVEEVDIFNVESEDQVNGKSYSYKVKRGQSLLYDSYKSWRELMLLENSLLLNRLTKSSIVRMINVEVGDMPKEMVGPHLQGIKSLIEQKASLNTDGGLSEYTNPGPIENNIYVPTHGGIGAISTTQVGGDIDVKGIADIDHYQDKLFGSLRAPKQYFGITDDNAGFSGGESLSIIASRYAKMVKRIQSIMIQLVTDAVNLMLLDAGLDSYINNFTIHMLPPTTREEIDRRDAASNRIGLVSDIMNTLTDIDNNVIKLKILKGLLSKALNDQDLTELMQSEIERLESEAQEQAEESLDTSDSINSESLDFDTDIGSSEPIGLDLNTLSSSEGIEPIESSNNIETSDNSNVNSSEESLPTPEDIGLDFTDATNPEFTPEG